MMPDYGMNHIWCNLSNSFATSSVFDCISVWFNRTVHAFSELFPAVSDIE